MKVSICIPTYNRVGFLVEALNSCLDQTRKPYEILIGDDSNNDETEQEVTAYKQQCQIAIRYFHNKPSRGQANNIKTLFERAEGDKILLLHDDDLLLPEALEKLTSCFHENPDVEIVFGKQFIIDQGGQVDLLASERLNKSYCRTKKYEGSVLTPIEAGISQQFPNDCYIFNSSLIKKVNYRSNSPEIGDLGYGCEYDFGVQVGLMNSKMFFINEHIGMYRLSSGNSISSSGKDDAGLKSFLILSKTVVPLSSNQLKTQLLKKKISLAVSQAAILGRRKEAYTLYFSKWHRQRIISLGGIKRFIMILFPKYFIKGSL